MQSTNVYVGLLRERGRHGLPLKRVYRQLFNRNLYLSAYGKIYRNAGATTKGVTDETTARSARWGYPFGAISSWRKSCCFGSLDHDLLVSVLSEKIEDGRFLTLMKKLLDAGYLEDWRFNQTDAAASPRDQS